MEQMHTSYENPLETVNLCIIHSFIQQATTELQTPSTLPDSRGRKMSEAPSLLARGSWPHGEGTGQQAPITESQGPQGTHKRGLPGARESGRLHGGGPGS